MRLQPNGRAIGHLAAVVLPLVAAMSLSTGAAAADGEDESGWFFRVAPYFWTAGIDGEVRAGERTVELDKGFGEIFSDVDFGIMGALEVGKGPLSLAADVVYLNLSTDEAAGPGGAGASAEFQHWLVSGGLTWYALRRPWGSFGIIAGGRYVNLQTDLELRRQGRTLTPSAEDDWIDPFAGVRGRLELWSDVFVPYLVTAGGVTVGSDFTTEGYTGLGYEFRWIDVVLTYRYLYMNRESEGFAFDATYHGLRLGVVVGF